MTFRHGLTAVLCVLGLAWAQAALANPQWTSDQVRAARPLASVETLSFDMKSETTGGSGAGVTQTAVSLAPSFTYTATGQNRGLEDDQLCRTLGWREGERTYGNDSCYALVAFRAAELGNRRVLEEALKRVGAKVAGAGEPYWYEAELGLAADKSPRLTVRRSAEAVDYLLGDKVVVRVFPSATKLTPEEMHRFARFLARQLPIHPQVRGDLVASGLLPARIELDLLTLGQPTHMSIAFDKVRREPLAYPLPSGLDSALKVEASGGQTPRELALAKLLPALDGAPQPDKPTRDGLISAMTAATDPLDAILIFDNLTQQYGWDMTQGPDHEALMGKVRPTLQRISGDPVVARFLAVNRLAGDPQMAGDREAAARFLASELKTEGRPFGTFRYVTYANLVRGVRGADKWAPDSRASMPKALIDNYWIHIRAYPWASNAYKDAGDVYFEAYDMPKAWQLFDLGRSIDPGWRNGAMAAVDSYEGQLRQNLPEFF